MKSLVLGGAGMLGHKIFQKLNSRGQDVACTLSGSKFQPHLQPVPELQGLNVIEGVNAMDFDSLQKLLVELQPEVIINCIGIIKQRDSAAAFIPSITINSLLPHKLAEWSGNWGGRVIHFSTDCVFDGKRGGYAESDRSDADDLYGKSKFLGEVQAANSITLRTSIVGRELSNFKSLLEWFIAQDGKRVTGYTGSIYSGVTTNHMADVVDWIIDEHPSLHGLYQVVSTPINKYDLLCKFKSAFSLQIEVEPVVGESLDRSMLGYKFASATGYSCPNWDSLVEQIALDATNYDAHRSNRA